MPSFRLPIAAYQSC